MRTLKDISNLLNEVIELLDDAGFYTKANNVENLRDDLQSMLGPKSYYRHKKTGRIEEFQSMALLQVSTDASLVDQTPMVAYRGDDGQLYVRSALEFGDGRFEFVETR